MTVLWFVIFLLACLIVAGQQISPSYRVSTQMTSTTMMPTESACERYYFRQYNMTAMGIGCPPGSILSRLDIENLNSTILESIELLVVWTLNVSTSNHIGPLTTIPSDICRFTKLKHLQLFSNRINNDRLNHSSPCLLELRALDLGRNLLIEIPVSFINPMVFLETLDLSGNQIRCLSYHTFHNISNFRRLLLGFNRLTSIELWILQIQDEVYLAYNPIDRFSNYFNVDLSHLQTRKIPKIDNVNSSEIYFDDTVFEMYNRCAEVHNIANFFTTYIPSLTLGILEIIKNTQPFYSQCLCEKFYFYRTAFAAGGFSYDNFFSDWICPGDTISFVQKCHNQSSANFNIAIPRLCKIKESENGPIPVFADSDLCGANQLITIDEQTTDWWNTMTTTKALMTGMTNTTSSTTEIRSTSTRNVTTTTTTQTTSFPSIFLLSNETLAQLEDITVLDSSTAEKFSEIINQADVNIPIDEEINEETQRNFRKAINQTEKLIQSVNSSLNVSDAAVAVYSSTKNNSIYQLSQVVLPDSSPIYSSESNVDDITASISIDQSFTNQLTYDDIYRFFFLPSSLFRYAQTNQRIDIVSPIVGARLPDNLFIHVNLSFIDSAPSRSSGRYSCGFWQFDHWDTSTCEYFESSISDYHQCNCTHVKLRSFALLFIPNGTRYETFLPSVITALLSILGLFISIIISVYQQTTPQAALTTRHFSIANIICLISSLILFILFTTILFNEYPSSTVNKACQSSSLNLSLTLYFFLLLTFASKTLLGLFYFCTIFIQLAIGHWTIMPGKSFLVSLLMVIVIALVPTIVAVILEYTWTNIFIQYENICWFSSSYLTKFIIIPISIFVGINAIVFMLILLRLLQFLFRTTITQATDKRLKTAICIWLASGIFLGVAWILGPFLGLLVDEQGETSSIVGQGIQWIFTLLIGLEGVAVLIVNVLFYSKTQQKRAYRLGSTPHSTRKWKNASDRSKIYTVISSAGKRSNN